jgi:hypothetical protein
VDTEGAEGGASEVESRFGGVATTARSNERSTADVTLAQEVESVERGKRVASAGWRVGYVEGADLSSEALEGELLFIRRKQRQRGAARHPGGLGAGESDGGRAICGCEGVSDAALRVACSASDGLGAEERDADTAVRRAQKLRLRARGAFGGAPSKRWHALRLQAGFHLTRPHRVRHYLSSQLWHPCGPTQPEHRRHLLSSALHI